MPNIVFPAKSKIVRFFQRRRLTSGSRHPLATILQKNVMADKQRNVLSAIIRQGVFTKYDLKNMQDKSGKNQEN